ncbi:hypothetical protein EC845_2340 [Comamonas sp. BIGb0124]|uniref:hypothetical protein n=1 Tax=Comamonas sp. BIGb0124 TaxID=2485130 RepID=UPI000F499FE6|nr:hypothetical protein [Comamonas sp. BIGb0124]ROR21518.1 hypothetical protein EC845_2340 [Comamonas sp. BIGb0124]
MEYLKVFLFLFAPFLTWVATAKILGGRGVGGPQRHAIGIVLGLAVLIGAITLIARTTERTLPPPNAGAGVQVPL